MLVAAALTALVAFGSVYLWQVRPALQIAGYAVKVGGYSEEENYQRSTSVLASTRSVVRQLAEQKVEAEVETTPGYLYRIAYRCPEGVSPQLAQDACVDTLAPLIRDWPDTAWSISLHAGDERLFYASYNPRTRQVRTGQ